MLDVILIASRQLPGDTEILSDLFEFQKPFHYTAKQHNHAEHRWLELVQFGNKFTPTPQKVTDNPKGSSLHRTLGQAQ